AFDIISCKVFTIFVTFGKFTLSFISSYFARKKRFEWGGIEMFSFSRSNKIFSQKKMNPPAKILSA
ncbi:MAG: hypothetical protein ACOCTN_05550, partial [Candidatus Natronoplasma sp.]